MYHLLCTVAQSTIFIQYFSVRDLRPSLSTLHQRLSRHHYHTSVLSSICARFPYRHAVTPATLPDISSSSLPSARHHTSTLTCLYYTSTSSAYISWRLATDRSSRYLAPPSTSSLDTGLRSINWYSGETASWHERDRGKRRWASCRHGERDGGKRNNQSL
jgi:hypothetical protein